MLATDLADYLVRKGMPFRQAHHAVGAVVALAERTGKALNELTLARIEIRGQGFGPDALAVFDLKKAMAQRNLTGAPGTKEVREAIGEVEDSLLRRMSDRRLRRVPKWTPRNNSLTDLLKETSRSFYLTLRVLPAKRPAADRPGVSAGADDGHHRGHGDRAAGAATRRAAGVARDAFLGDTRRAAGFWRTGATAGFGRRSGCCWSVARRRWRCWSSFDAADRQRIREVLRCHHQRAGTGFATVRRASEENIVALKKDAELDDYTYRVAGCVGEFWTKMCRAHLFPGAALDEAMLLANGVRFGKGLQLVNILRDLPVDLRNGRCYLPAEELCARD